MRLAQGKLTRRRANVFNEIRSDAVHHTGAGTGVHVSSIRVVPAPARGEATGPPVSEAIGARRDLRHSARFPPGCCSRSSGQISGRVGVEQPPVGRNVPGCGQAVRPARSGLGVTRMRDLVFVICTVVFFMVSIAYVWACDRLK